MRERLPGLLGDRLAARGGGRGGVGGSHSACCRGPGPPEGWEVPAGG